MTKEQRERLEYVDKLFSYKLTCSYCTSHIKREFSITTCDGCPIYSQNFNID